MILYQITLLTVESKSRGHCTCIGMDMNQQKVVTLVVFQEKNSMQKRHLKELIIDMTHKNPRKRIDIQKVCIRLNRESLSCCPKHRVIYDATNCSLRLKSTNDQNIC